MHIFQKLYLKIRRLLGIRDDVHYINGSQTLPPPLTAEEEAKVMANIAAGAANAREPLITHNLRLVVYIAKNLKPAAPAWRILSLLGQSV